MFAKGQRSLAGELACDAADWSAEHGQHTAEVLALHDAVRLTDDRTAARRLVEAGPAVEGVLARIMTADADAFLDDDASAVEDVA